MITEKIREILKALEGKYPSTPVASLAIAFGRDGSDAFGYKDNLLLKVQWHTLVVEAGDLDKPIDQILAEVEQPSTS